MFESVTDSGRKKNWRSTAASIAAHVAIIAVMVLGPMWFTEAQPIASLKASETTTPPPPLKIPRAIPVVDPPGGKQPASAPRKPAELFTPERIPEKITPKDFGPVSDTAPSVPNVTGGIPNGIPGGDNNGVPFGDVNFGPTTRQPQPPPPPPAPIPPPPPPPAPPQRIGGDVAAANLDHQVKPQYPPLARAARVQDYVILQAVISKTGTIEDLKVLRGHPLLNEAAMEAVRQWRYRPQTLNGLPIEVVTTITVNFSFSQ
jgi:protein TonB